MASDMVTAITFQPHHSDSSTGGIETCNCRDLTTTTTISLAAQRIAATSHSIKSTTSMSTDMADAAEYALWICWTLLSLIPAKIKNPVHDIVFGTEQIMATCLSAVTFSPGVLDALQSHDPPTVAFFKTLPTHAQGLWGVYLLVLEKVGFRPKVYVGSGTNTKSGIPSRFSQYDNYETSPSRLPQFVIKALDDGFDITHKGVLCSAPIPTAVTRFPLRTLFLILETVFHVALWTFLSKNKTYGMPNMLSWSIEALEYDGCNTHAPITEVVWGEGDGLTPQQIADKEAQMDVRRRESVRASQQKTYAKIATDDFLRARKRANGNRTVARNKASKKFFCKPCQKACQSLVALKSHQTTDTHILKTTGKKPVKVTKSAGQIKADKVRAAKTHYCSICEYAAHEKRILETHLKGAWHAKKVLEAAEAAEAEKAGKKYVKPTKEGRVRAAKTYYCSICQHAAASPSKLERHLKGTWHAKEAAKATKAEKAEKAGK